MPIKYYLLHTKAPFKRKKILNLNVDIFSSPGTKHSKMLIVWQKVKSSQAFLLNKWKKYTMHLFQHVEYSWYYLIKHLEFLSISCQLHDMIHKEFLRKIWWSLILFVLKTWQNTTIGRDLCKFCFSNDNDLNPWHSLISFPFETLYTWYIIM